VFSGDGLADKVSVRQQIPEFPPDEELVEHGLGLLGALFAHG